MNRLFALASAFAALVQGLGLQAAGADPRGPLPPIDYSWSPSLTGPLSKYAFDLGGLGDLKLKLGKQCFMLPDRRGVKFTSSADDGSGNIRYGFPVGDRFQAWGAIDVKKLRRPLAFAGFEFRSPDASGAPFMLFGAVRNPDGSIGAFANDTGANVGTPQVFAGDQDCLLITINYQSGLFSASYAYAGGPQSILDNYAFTYDTSGGIGAALFAAGKGDAVTLTLDVTGDLFDVGTQGVLNDLQAALQLEQAAQMDLQNSNDADAKTKLEQAGAIIDMGSPIPLTDPQQFTGALIPRAKALFPDEATMKQIEKQLAKARKKDGDAVGKIDDGKRPDALKRAGQAVDAKLRAKAIIETGNPGEHGI